MVSIDQRASEVPSDLVERTRGIPTFAVEVMVAATLSLSTMRLARLPLRRPTHHSGLFRGLLVFDRRADRLRPVGLPNITRWLDMMKTLQSWNQINEVSNGFVAANKDKDFAHR